MNSDELRELLTLEDYFNRTLRRLQRQIIASGGTIPEDGDICGLTQAEAIAEIEEEARIAQSSEGTAGAQKERDWLEQNFGMEKTNDNLGISSRRYLQRQRQQQRRHIEDE